MYIIPQRDLHTMTLGNLYKTRNKAIQELTEATGRQYQELWEFLTSVNRWIKKKVSGQEYLKIKGRKRGGEIDYCGFDDVINEQLIK